jgi:hypothetical protein
VEFRLLLLSEELVAEERDVHVRLHEALIGVVFAADAGLPLKDVLVNTGQPLWVSNSASLAWKRE